jgi:hypothetical protein
VTHLNAHKGGGGSGCGGDGDDNNNNNNSHNHHKHQGLDPLIRSVSRVTTVLAKVSLVFQRLVLA